MKRTSAVVAVAAIAASTILVGGALPATADTFPGPPGRIAYASGGIWSMAADGTDAVRLGDGEWPSWSPDGHRVAYSYVVPGEYIESIWVMNADGTGKQRVAGGGAGGPSSWVIATHPSWSPDGTEIAFSRAPYELVFGSYQPARAEIAAVKPDGSGLRLVTSDAGRNDQPAWSPDGSRIAFTTSRNPGPTFSDINYDVYVVDADGTSAATQLTSEPGWEEYPSWSPDGQRIVYDRWAVANTNSSIWMMDGDGGNQRPLSAGADTRGWMPTFSPDGTAVLFAQNVGGSDWNIVTAPATGGPVTTLTSGPGTEWMPAWQADSTPPTIECDDAPTFTVGEQGASVTATASDDPGGSGVADGALSAPADTSTDGAFEVAFTATDRAGNTSAQQACGYTVVPPPIFGELAAPVDPRPAVNAAKAGRVVPIRFRVTDADGMPVLGLDGVVARSTDLACDATSTQPDAIEEYVAASGFRDHGDGWYQWNWATPASYAGSCRTLTVEVQGTVVVTADFAFKR